MHNTFQVVGAAYVRKALQALLSANHLRLPLVRLSVIESIYLL